MKKPKKYYKADLAECYDWHPDVFRKKCVLAGVNIRERLLSPSQVVAVITALGLPPNGSLDEFKPYLNQMISSNTDTNQINQS